MAETRLWGQERRQEGSWEAVTTCAGLVGAPAYIFSGKGKERGEIRNYFTVSVGRSDCVDQMGYRDNEARKG